MIGFESLGQWLINAIDKFADYLKPWVLVQGYEEAVVLRVGKYNRTLPPGLHLKWPIMEYHMFVMVKPETVPIEPVIVGTADGKTVVCGLMIHYDIVDSRLFQVENNDSISNVKDIGRGEMSDLLEEISWEDISKKTTKNRLRRNLEPKLADMGIRILDLKFTQKYITTAYNFINGTENYELNAIKAQLLDK